MPPPTRTRDDNGLQVTRGGRLVAPAIAAKPADRSIMEVSTVVADGEKEVVRRQPFAHVKMALAPSHVTTEDYPLFDPLAIFPPTTISPPPPTAPARSTAPTSNSRSA